MKNAVREVEKLFDFPEAHLIGCVLRFEGKDFRVVRFYDDLPGRRTLEALGQNDFSISLSKPLHSRELSTLHKQFEGDAVTLSYLEEWVNS